MSDSYWRNKPCPCNSGRISKKCCLVGNKWVLNNQPKVSSIPDTQFSHPKCYASFMNNCSQDISREHYISHTVLELIGENIYFPEFAKKREIPNPYFPLSALVSKILCTRHNSQLSYLDSFAGNLFGEIFNVDSYFKNKSDNEPKITLWSGYLFEKWLLKTYIGLALSKIFEKDTDRVNLLRKNNDLIKILFDDRNFSRPFGLQFSNKIGDTFDIVKNDNRKIQISFDLDKHMICIMLESLKFYFYATRQAESIGNKYRLSRFNFRNNSGKEYSLIFLGENNDFDGYVSIIKL